MVDVMWHLLEVHRVLGEPLLVPWKVLHGGTNRFLLIPIKLFIIDHLALPPAFAAFCAPGLRAVQARSIFSLPCLKFLRS